MSKATNFTDLIWEWPSDEILAADLGVSPITIRSMRRRNYIHPDHWPALVNSARRHGLGYVTYKYLFSLPKREDVAA